MKISTILREQKKFWIPLVSLLILNGLIFVGYRYLFFGKIRAEWNQKKQLEEKYRQVSSEHDRLERTLTSLKQAIQDKNEFYQTLDRKENRLTTLLAHLDELTRNATLIPHSWGFGESETNDLIPLDEFTISFPVEGSYASIRQLLHFLELTDQFIIVRAISLRETGELMQNIRFMISMSTYFYRENPAKGKRERRKRAS